LIRGHREFFSSFTVKQEPIIDIKYNKTLQLVNVPASRFYTAGDEALLTFDLKADFRPLWNWNTKQLFVYITCEYETPHNPFNQVVIWDRIITEKELSNLNLENEFPEYPLIDPQSHLRARRINLTVSYNEIPITGLLLWNTRGLNIFQTIPSYVGNPTIRSPYK